MTEQTNIPNPEPPKWSQFEKLIDLHKFYFENLIKAATFSLGIIGAILTYAIGTLKNGARNEVILILLFPTLLSAGSFFVYLLGCWKTYDLNQKVDLLKGKKNLNLEWKPHTEILIWMCGIFALLFLILTIGLIWLMYNPSLLQSIPGKSG